MYNILDLFIDGLFRPGIKINPDYRTKYLHILAYSCTVAETYKKVRYACIIFTSFMYFSRFN